jgi:type IV pilus assembly protein PilW
MQRAPHRHQAGLGLLELMVAMVVGLFILLGLSAVFVNVKQAFTAQERLAALQDDERLALTVLTTTIQQAGYFPDPLTNTAVTALPAVTGGTIGFAPGQSVAGSSGAGSASDTITSRYVAAPNDGLINCIGETNTGAANAIMVNTFSVTAEGLQCSLDGGATNISLVSNVVSMKVVYGVDTTNSGNADQYMSAAGVGAAWPSVRTARITVNFTNPFASQPGQPPTIAWTQTIALMNKS